MTDNDLMASFIGGAAVVVSCLFVLLLILGLRLGGDWEMRSGDRRQQRRRR